MDKKRLFRHRSESCDGRLKIPLFKWSMIGLTFGSWVYFSSIIVLRQFETVSNVSPSPQEPRQIWKPYQLTHHEYSTGQLSFESCYTGTYIFDMINNDEDIKRDFRIHFPIDLNTIEGKTIVSHDLASPSTCLWTYTGAKGYDVPNQDRLVVIADHSVNGESDWSLAALFDGHGDFGHVTSHVAVTNLPSLILKSVFTEINSKVDSNVLPNSIVEKMKKAFQKIDRKGVIPEVPRGGSTAIAVLQWGHWIHIASIGDSTAVLVQWLKTDHLKGDRKQTTNASRYKIIASAVKHKPSDPLERERIEKNGGYVYIPTNPSESSRVIFDVIDENGRQRQTGLAMSRSLGDTPSKEQHVVIADPDILSIDLSEYLSTSSKATTHEPPKGHFFVVLASDGVTDMVALDEIIHDVGYALYNSDTQDNLQSTLMLGNACQMIVKGAAKAWNVATENQYRDDISLAVHRII